MRAPTRSTRSAIFGISATQRRGSIDFTLAAIRRGSHGVSAANHASRALSLSGADSLVPVSRGRATHSRGGAAALRELAEEHAPCATGEAPERSDLRAAAFCHAVRRFSFDPAVLPHMSNSPTELTGLAGRIALGS